MNEKYYEKGTDNIIAHLYLLVNVQRTKVLNFVYLNKMQLTILLKQHNYSNFWDSFSVVQAAAAKNFSKSLDKLCKLW